MTERCGLPGIWPAMMTPLDEHLNIDPVRFAAHAHRLIGAGCGGVTPFGTTGEGPSFSVEERRQAVQALVAAGVSPQQILVSVSATALPDVVALTRHAQDIGAWGVMMMAPFFFRDAPQEGVFAAFDQVLDQTRDRPLRMVVYHIPQVNGTALSIDTIQRLHQRWPQRIVALKDSACRLDQSLAYAAALMPPLGVHVGNEPDLPHLGRLGSGGAVSGIANFMPRTVRTLALEPDTPQAAQALARIQQLLASVGGYALIPAVKAVLGRLSADPAWGRVRPPLAPLDDAALAALDAALAPMGLDLRLD